MWSNPQSPADLVTFTKEILNQNLIFCAVGFAVEGFHLHKKWENNSEII